MAIFIKLNQDERKTLFYKARDNLNTSFNKMYLRFKISRPMFFHYLAGRYHIPKSIFLELQSIAKIQVKGFLEIKIEKYLEKNINKPKLNNSVAEILGVLNGDGHLSSINYEISVVGSSLEIDYSDYLKKLFEKNLGLKFIIDLDKTRYKLRTYSKKMVEYLGQEYGLPKGKKLGKLKIPRQIMGSREFLVSYLRGLYDTDGTFYIRRKKDPAIEISSADINFLKQVRKALTSLGFHANVNSTHVSIYNKEDINNFFKIVQPAKSISDDFS
jgi:DNA-binding transcriptional regulator WhiA